MLVVATIELTLVMIVLMEHLEKLKNHGVMVIVHGATISVWHQEQVINLLIFTLTEAGLTTLNMLQHQEV